MAFFSPGIAFEDAKLKRRGLSALLAVLLMPALAAMGQLPAAVVNFGREFAREAAACQAAYAAATNRIPAKYTRDLEALRAKFQEAGDLDSLLAVKNEIARYKKAKSEEADPFETVPEMTAEVIVAAPAELRQLQEQYVASFTDAAAALRKGVAERGERYRAQIKEAQSALTKAGKIEEAIAVRDAGARISRLLDSGDLSELLAAQGVSTVAEAAKDTAAAPAKTPVQPSGTKAPASTTKATASTTRWRYRQTRAFSRDLPNYFAPDVPDELSGEFDTARNRGSVTGRCVLAAKQVGDVLCSWNGRAFLWDVADASSLPVEIRVKTQTLSAGSDRGPYLEVAVFANGFKRRAISVPLGRPDEIVKIMRDTTRENGFALNWPHGKQLVPFEIQNGERINVLIGVVLHNVGEACNVSFQLSGAN